MTEYQGRHHHPPKTSRTSAVVHHSDSTTPQRRQARQGAVNHYEFRRSSSAHRRAAREFPTYDTSGIRPRHSKRHTAMVIALVAVLLAVVGTGAWLAYNHFATPPQIEAGTPVSVTIDEGASATEIARRLRQVGVITDESAFINALKERGVVDQLKPGDYQLVAGMDISDRTGELIDTLIAGPKPLENGVKLTIPEGLTIEQTAERIAATEGLSVKAADFIALAHQAEHYLAEYPFLEGAYNNSLEGFLYPKTYTIPTAASADDLIRILLDQFASEIKGLDLSFASEHNLPLYSVLTIASLIEKETAADDERPLVASVIYNRLSEGMRLQIDATVIYALGSSYDGHPLLNVDLEVDSPFNTYLVDELPAGPICSPQLKSIQAAAHPADTSYLYYVLTSKEGFHTFCASYDEFEAAKAVYQEVFGIQ